MKNTEKKLEIPKLEIIDRTISIGYNPNTGLKELQRTINDAIEKYVALYREETDKEYQRRTEDLRKRQQLALERKLKIEANKKLREKVINDPRYKQFLELKKEFGKYV